MKPESVEISFSPADNRRLANLCGVLDENIKQVENTFNIEIFRRGEHFCLYGAADQTRLAAKALKNFYDQSNQHISIEQIQLGLIEIKSLAAKNQLQPELSTQLHSVLSPQLITRRGNITGRTSRQTAYLQQIHTHDITFGIGPAGTGKTYLAVATAVDALERETVGRIILVRPAVEAGENLGFLPGDMAQKVDPYLRPLYDALYELMGSDKTGKQFERGAIEIAPLAFMRGRTLNQSFIILDEAQNTTPAQMKMFLTRIGFGSKAVITGDTTQVDLPKNQKSGLIEAEQVLSNIRGIAFTRFKTDDVVRHPLVQRIVDAYERHAVTQ
ncbi:PhoH family protein [Nitrosomonas mobilis]|uniref:PhoH-like protein n=1 Tax=Nitrosomonas mobilis TaxID=51642 RepID=A0A1G5SJD5_9PROT|nr:PhoH family protein [Nitrosomonas mobilis]SCZ86990.1 putative enzyme with nucleoside triphosphate hydrolase domain [Nitrosomonas mobilis]HNO76255.1 PhoH family protein [Nitrosomonas mobilis]